MKGFLYLKAFSKLLFFSLFYLEEEPPSYQIRSPPSDEGALNRAPGAFGDRAQRLKKPPAKKVKFDSIFYKKSIL